MNARKEMKYWPHTWYRRHSWCKTIENKDKRTRDHGDGTVMMIGEGGTSCTCADDGIEVIKQPLLKQRRQMKLNTTLQMRLRLHLNRTMHIPWICRLVKLWSESIKGKSSLQISCRPISKKFKPTGSALEDLIVMENKTQNRSVFDWILRTFRDMFEGLGQS